MNDMTETAVLARVESPDLLVMAARFHVAADELRRRAGVEMTKADNERRRIDRAAGRDFARQLEVLATQADGVGRRLREVCGRAGA